MIPKLHFRRFECKYLIDASLEAEIKAYLQRFVVPDPFAAVGGAGAYEVRSLYYDSPMFYYYHQKMDGVERRKKIRFRTYGTAANTGTNIFLEIKRKDGEIILKDRILMSRGEYEAYRRADDIAALPQREEYATLMEEFSWEMRTRSLSPKTLVVYDREPYLGRYHKELRVTFDRDIRAMENDNIFYTGHDFAACAPGHTVMEIKFNGSLPYYIKEVIQRFHLQRTSFSKYCMGIDRCGSLSRFHIVSPAGSAISEQLYLPKSTSVWAGF